MMPYEGSEPYVFVSYNHDDAKRVLQLVELMQQNGIRVWFDEINHRGENWRDIIKERIEHCHVFIAFLSKQYCRSEFCFRELDEADKAGKKPFAYFLDGFSGSRLKKYPALSVKLSGTQNITSVHQLTKCSKAEQLLNASCVKECCGSRTNETAQERSGEKFNPQPPALPEGSSHLSGVQRFRLGFWIVSAALTFVFLLLLNAVPAFRTSDLAESILVDCYFVGLVGSTIGMFVTFIIPSVRPEGRQALRAELAISYLMPAALLPVLFFPGLDSPNVEWIRAWAEHCLADSEVMGVDIPKRLIEDAVDNPVFVVFLLISGAAYLLCLLSRVLPNKAEYRNHLHRILLLSSLNCINISLLMKRLWDLSGEQCEQILAEYPELILSEEAAKLFEEFRISDWPFPAYAAAVVAAFGTVMGIAAAVIMIRKSIRWGKQGRPPVPDSQRILIGIDAALVLASCLSAIFTPWYFLEGSVLADLMI